MKRLILMLMLVLSVTVAMIGAALAEDQYFVAVGEFDEAAAKANPEAMTAHIEYLNKLYDDGVLWMAGPFGEGNAGAILVKASSMDEAKQLLHADPSIKAGVIKPVAFHTWHAFFNKPANQRMSVADFQAMMASGEMGEMEGGGDAMDHAAAMEEGAAGEGMDMPTGGVNFLQIPTTDVAASSKFYSELFGWEIQPMDMEGMQITFFSAPGGMSGEFSTMNKVAAPMSGVTFYINTESVTAMLARVQAAGGTVIQPVMDLPEEFGYIAIIGDPSGNAVGLWSQGP